MIHRLFAYSLILLGIIGTIYMGFEGIYREQYEIPTVSIASLGRQLADSTGIIFIDVRTLKEVSDRPAPWPDALNIPLLELEGRATELTEFGDSPIVVLCPTGNRSHEGARILRLAGFEAAYIEDGMFIKGDTTGK